MKITFSKITVIILIILINFLFNINIVNAYSGDLHLNTLEFKVNINYDGSMDVIELWNINIKNTNTLFKTFEIVFFIPFITFTIACLLLTVIFMQRRKSVR